MEVVGESSYDFFQEAWLYLLDQHIDFDKSDQKMELEATMILRFYTTIHMIFLVRILDYSICKDDNVSRI